MEKPVIDGRTSILGAETGETITFQPAATPAPNIWSASELPTGLAFTSSTGRITGTSAPGVYGIALVASKYYDRAFTANASTDVFTATGHGFADGIKVQFIGSDLPAPLVAATDYYVRDSDQANGTFKVATALGGAALNLTDAGTGTQTVRTKVDSDPLTILVSFFPEVVVVQEVQDDLTIKVNFDMVTGKVTIPGTESVLWGPPGIKDGVQKAALRIKQSDRFPILLGVTREDGTLQDLPLTSIRIGTKEREPEKRLVLTESETDFLKIGTGDETRYRIMVHCDKAVFAKVLANYESDGGTFYDALAEITIGIIYDLVEYSQTQTQPLASLTGGQTRNQTFNFVDLPKTGSGKGYTLTLSLAVPTKPGQNASLERTFDLLWDGNAYAVQNLAGSTSDQGDDETPHWRTTLSNLAISASGTGLSISSRVQTSSGTMELAIVFSLYHFSIPDTGHVSAPTYGALQEQLDLYHFLYSGSEWTSPLGYLLLDDGDTPATIEAKIEAIPWLAGDVVQVRLNPSTQQITVVINADSQLGWIVNEQIPQWNFRANYQGDVRDATVTALLVADDNAGDEQRKSSETYLFRIERDLNPD